MHCFYLTTGCDNNSKVFGTTSNWMDVHLIVPFSGCDDSKKWTIPRPTGRIVRELLRWKGRFRRTRSSWRRCSFLQQFTRRFQLSAISKDRFDGWLQTVLFHSSNDHLTMYKTWGWTDVRGYDISRKCYAPTKLPLLDPAKMGCNIFISNKMPHTTM